MPTRSGATLGHDTSTHNLIRSLPRIKWLQLLIGESVVIELADLRLLA